MTIIDRDFVASVYIVHDDKVLLLFHKKIKLWIAPGGHIEKNELPDEAALREVKEETGLDVELLGERFPGANEPGIVRVLPLPFHVQLEVITPIHEHIDIVYLAVPTGTVKIDNKEDHQFRWFSETDLDDKAITNDVRFFGKLAIKRVRELQTKGGRNE